jgi:hypothetical protein
VLRPPTFQAFQRTLLAADLAVLCSRWAARVQFGTPPAEGLLLFEVEGGGEDMIEDGRVAAYRAKVKISFELEQPD